MHTQAFDHSILGTPGVGWSSETNPFANSKNFVITGDMMFCFEDGTEISGKELTTYLKVLQRIVETNYPEELL